MIAGIVPAIGKDVAQGVFETIVGSKVPGGSSLGEIVRNALNPTGEFNLDAFRASLSNSGVSNKSHFHVELERIPQGMSKYLGSREVQDMKFLCEDAQIPGRSVSFLEYKDLGQPWHIADGGYQDSDLNLSILTRRGLGERSFFEVWQNLVVNYATETTNIDDGRVGYYESYVGKIKVIKWSAEGKKEAEFTYFDAYPVTIQEINMSWQENDDIVRTTVQFKYRSWRSEYFDDTGNTLADILAQGNQFKNQSKKIINAGRRTRNFVAGIFG